MSPAAGPEAPRRAAQNRADIRRRGFQSPPAARIWRPRFLVVFPRLSPNCNIDRLGTPQAIRIASGDVTPPSIGVRLRGLGRARTRAQGWQERFKRLAFGPGPPRFRSDYGDGVLMKKFGVVMAAAIASAGVVPASVARAADLPTKKEAPPAPPVNCYASVWTWLDSTAADCPLTWGPFTAYATLDVGGGWQSNGARASTTYPNSVASFVSKQSYGSRWLWPPNGVSQSVVGIKMSQPLAYGWSLVGTAETGFNPYSWNLANGQRTQVQNNGLALPLQGANADSGRSGQWDNSQGFIGFSNKTYGTLVGGRVNTLGLDGLVAYDPMGSAYAFSPFGYSGSYAGFGDTELTRSNTALKYRG